MGKQVVSDEEDEIEFRHDDGGFADADESYDRDDDDQEEDDEEGQDEYEKDDFIVDDVEEEEEEQDEERAESDNERHKKKKKKKREFEDVLDEDDYELLRDNNAFPHRPMEGKKFKRLKKAQRDLDEDHAGLYDEDFDLSGKSGRTAEEKLEHSLFDVEDGVQLGDIADEDEVEEGEEAYIADDDEMADFIVPEEVDDDGAPMRQKKFKLTKSRPASGVTSSSLQEALELFGDVDPLLQMRKELEYNEQKERKLEDEFEPLVLSEKYITEKDEQIKATDIPERIQISEESVGSPLVDDISIEEEGTWIHAQIANGAVPFISETRSESSFENDRPNWLHIKKDDIIRFLELHHVQKLDVSFIAMYRKEECLSLLRSEEENEVEEEDWDKSDTTPKIKLNKVLWAVKELDKKWLRLQKRKNVLYAYFTRRFEEETRRIYDERRLNLNQQVYASIMKCLSGGASERKFDSVAKADKEIDDIDAKFNLYFPPGEVGLDEGQFKRPKRKSLYSLCSRAGLWEAASKLGYSAERLGMHYSLVQIVDNLEDPKETPEEMASNFTCAMFETPQAVLKGARHMAATEISHEPSVRKHVRATYMEHAVVSTRPTAEGKAAIDAFHMFAVVKSLRQKPLSKFTNEQWLLIEKAEEEKLVRVIFELPEDRMKILFDDYQDIYLSQGVSRCAQLWNEQRKLILQDALSGFLLPSMEKEARSVLSSRAKSFLLWEYGSALWSRVSLGPFSPKENHVSSDDDSVPRVLSCCWGPGKPAHTFVMLDASGELLDVLYAGSLTLQSQNPNDQQRRITDQQRLLKFMTEYGPHVVVLGAANLSCNRLRDAIYNVIYEILDEHARNVGKEFDELVIVYGNETLPRLYETCRISAEQLPGQPGIVKRAVALGRYLQNPLAMVATLCGPGREILSWKLNPLDYFLSADEKYGMIELVMVDATNQVGLDVNSAINHEWQFAPLQFISGFGPRKAAHLQRSLTKAGAILSRMDFLTAHGLGKKVFINAGGFLRVRRSGLDANSSQYLDLLDDTRIHPESYRLAQEMALDVLLEQNSVSNDDEDSLEMAVELVREQPSLMKSLQLGHYLLDKRIENKRETFIDMKRELIQGFVDWRRPQKKPDENEALYMLSGETSDTLAEGKIVQATVRRVNDYRAICVLDCGLSGMLSKEDYAGGDGMDNGSLSDRLHEGDLLTCMVKSFQMNRLLVFLTTNEGEMRNQQNLRNRDPYYHEDENDTQTEQEKVHKVNQQAKKHFKPRMISHPRFQNITTDEAVEFLADKSSGENVFHPSLRGPTYLTLTLKVYDGVYAHKEISESGFGKGKTLKIGDDTFEDLDEVMYTYVDPLVVFLRSMLSYRKFRAGTKSEVDELLCGEKSQFPSRIVYSLGVSHEHPGSFILAYIRSSNPHHEYVGLYPKGFKFRKRMFEDIDRLVAYFQKHIDDPLRDSAPSLRSVAAMVPMRSPALGADSSRGSVGSGWGSTNDGFRRNQPFDAHHHSGRGDSRSGGSESQRGGPPRPNRGRGRGRWNAHHNHNSNQSGGSYQNYKDETSPSWGSFHAGDSLPGANESSGRVSFRRDAKSPGWGSFHKEFSVSTDRNDGWASACGGNSRG